MRVWWDLNVVLGWPAGEMWRGLDGDKANKYIYSHLDIVVGQAQGARERKRSLLLNVVAFFHAFVFLFCREYEKSTRVDCVFQCKSLDTG